MKISKNKKAAIAQIDKGNLYGMNEATALLKKVTYTKFDSSVDIDIRLGVDPKKANQMVRGITVLPHGIGKEITVLVLCNSDNEKEAKEAGADYAGLEDYLEKIKGGWSDVDVIITSPDIMPKLGKYGKVLGPKGLMPNPKAGTVTNDVPKAVTEVKSGKIDFKVDKYGIIHSPVGRVSFSTEQLNENIAELVQTVVKLKPSGAKGTYIKSLTISSTMSPGIRIDIKSIPDV